MLLLPSFPIPFQLRYWKGLCITQINTRYTTNHNGKLVVMKVLFTPWTVQLYIIRLNLVFTITYISKVKYIGTSWKKNSTFTVVRFAQLYDFIFCSLSKHLIWKSSIIVSWYLQVWKIIPSLVVVDITNLKHLICSFTSWVTGPNCTLFVVYTCFSQMLKLMFNKWWRNAWKYQTHETYKGRSCQWDIRNTSIHFSQVNKQ